MAKTQPFNEHLEQYEDWFVENRAVYESELQAMRTLLPQSRRAVEIGVGSGLFATPLGIQFGVEPSAKMRRLAKERGVRVIAGVAEYLPLRSSAFDLASMVTTVCFVDDVLASFREVHRILEPGGAFLLGFVDRTSRLGQLYETHKAENVFYRLATFYSTDELLDLLEQADFGQFETAQTVFGLLHEIKQPEPVKRGYGEGAFVVIRARKQG